MQIDPKYRAAALQLSRKLTKLKRIAAQYWEIKHRSIAFSIASLSDFHDAGAIV